MKIKTKKMDYDAVMALPAEQREKPVRPKIFFRWILKSVGASDLKATNFKCQKVGMERLKANEPALFLMNHSSFIDLKIAANELYPRPFNIICTSDGFVGKKWLMRHLGCIPTKKFITDLRLIKDMIYAVDILHDSILMYPEASYSFDGTATPLPDSIGKFIKMLDVPVVMIRTYGAFARDPLYNMLQNRQVDVSATMTYLLSKEDIRLKSDTELGNIITEQFTFDNFKWQQDNEIIIKEAFRADGLNRVLYKCPACGEEGRMLGKGIHLSCRHCGKEWTLNEKGFLESDGEVYFNHVPDWYSWERKCVREELEDETYRMDIDVDIRMMVNMKAIYEIGEGHLTHSCSGFHLTGAGGKPDYVHSPKQSYSLYSDYYWYEIGDMICIGDSSALYYCFPKTDSDVVAKARLAAEELYKIVMKKNDGKAGAAPGTGRGCSV